MSIAGMREWGAACTGALHGTPRVVCTQYCGLCFHLYILAQSVALF